jgi:outer membrane protein assembly factor BamD (BamD/ComL family)
VWAALPPSPNPPEPPVATAQIDDDETNDKPAPAPPRPAAAAQGQARFEAALRLYTGRAGDTPDAAGATAAATALEQLARELPEDEIAPEALFEAAQLYDEQLGLPEQAQRLYAELLRRYPSSRLCRRAESRLTQLRDGLRTGADALTRFQRILRSTEEGSAARIAQLRALLGERPDFALADHALYLLGSAQLRAGLGSAAADTFAALASRFPASEWTAYGHKAQADAFIARGQCGQARPHLRALAERPGGIWPLAAAEGLSQCDSLDRRQVWKRLAVAYLVLLSLVLLYRGLTRRTLWPPPFEIWYYAPVAGFLVLASLPIKGGLFTAPVLLLAGLGGALSWLAAAAQQAGPAPRRPSRRVLFVGLGLLWRVAAVAALCYLVIETQGLYDVLVETLRNGADE